MTIMLTFPVFQSWNVQYKSDASKPFVFCRVQLERSVLWSGISTEIGDGLMTCNVQCFCSCSRGCDWCSQTPARLSAMYLEYTMT